MISDYSEYLKSPHWKEVSAQCREKYDNRCAICGSTEKLNVHHWTYERLGGEDPDDLICLCEECHERVHIALEGLKYELEDLYRGKSAEIWQIEKPIIAEWVSMVLRKHHTKYTNTIIRKFNDVQRAMRTRNWGHGPDHGDPISKIVSDIRKKE